MSMKKPIYFVGLIAIALIFFGAGCTSGCTNSTKSGLSQYSGKIFEISDTDGKIKGRVELKEKDGELLAYYHFLINDKLKDNDKCPSEPNQECGKNSYGYEYTANMEGNINSDHEKYVNTVTSVYCNNGTLPAEELNKSQNSMYYYSVCNDDYNQGSSTETFYIFLASYYNTYEDFLSTNKFALYGASDYWEKDDGGPDSYTINQGKAVEEGKKYRTYTFQVVE